MPEELEPLEGLVVDLDLDKEDAILREAIGKPTVVRVQGEVIVVQHPSLWSTKAMKHVNNGEWIEWAEEVIEDPDQFQHFQDCNLRNFQMQKIFERCGQDSGAGDLGKSRQRNGSSRNSRKR